MRASKIFHGDQASGVHRLQLKNFRFPDPQSIYVFSTDGRLIAAPSA